TPLVSGVVRRIDPGTGPRGAGEADAGPVDGAPHGLGACTRSGVRTVLEGHGDHIARSEEHTSELQSRLDLVCRLLLEKKHRGAAREAPILLPTTDIWTNKAHTGANSPTHGHSRTACRDPGF